MELQKLPYDLTVCRVSSLADADLSSDFWFVGRTDEEISLVCKTEDAPARAAGREDGWKGLRVRGALDFSLIGVLAGLCGVLAENSVSVFAVSTYNTDYILVKKESYDRALDALAAAGYAIR